MADEINERGVVEVAGAETLTHEQGIMAGQRLEPWMDLTDEYVAAASRMMEFHMMSEIVGPVHEFDWVARAPSLEAKLIFSAKSQDEVGHGLGLIRVCEDLTGKSRAQYVEEMLDGPPRFMNIFHYPWDQWADPVIVAWLVDGAEIERQQTLLKSSYGPYARAMKKIVREEGFHYHCGRYLASRMVEAGPSQKRKLQDALDRWMPRILAMFGPRDEVSTHGATLIKFGLKLTQNEVLRQSYLTKFVPRILAMGLELSDAAMVFNEETKLWKYTEPNWEEFRSLLRGGSPVGQDLQRRLRGTRALNKWLLDDTWTAAA